MNWHFPPGILRRGMSLEQDNGRFYTQTAERVSDEHSGQKFLGLDNREGERGGDNIRWRRLSARDKVPT